MFFDNVGGDILDAALAQLAMRGRVVLCGAIARYNDTEPAPGPKNYLNLLVQRGRMEGFIVLDYMPRASRGGDGALRLAATRASSRIASTCSSGLENAPRCAGPPVQGREPGQAARAHRGACLGVLRGRDAPDVVAVGFVVRLQANAVEIPIRRRWSAPAISLRCRTR